jgi:hypothetical protein
VRQEERRECDHDQVVQKERPAREEPGEIVRSAANEGRGTAGLRQGGGALGIGERDDEEEQSDTEQDERCETERVDGDDAECEVDRGRDLAVGHGEESACVELAAQPGQLAGH